MVVACGIAKKRTGLCCFTIFNCDLQDLQRA